MPINYKDYLFNNNADKRTGQKKFELLCDDIASGKYDEKIEDSVGNVIPGEITTERFKMAYDRLDKDDPFYLCRLQLPKYYFVSKDGYIITLSNQGKGKHKPKWYRGNKAQDARTEMERYIKITTPASGEFKGTDKTGKKVVVNIANYTIVAIMYGSILIADQTIKDNLKKYGLEVFGVKNGGNLPKELKKKGKAGVRGLYIGKREKIPFDDMLETHHVEGKKIIDPNLLEIMPHWLHEYLKYFTASCSSAEEIKNLIAKDPDCFDRLNKLIPSGYIIEDHSKIILNDGTTDVYIHYEGVNENKLWQNNSRQVDSSEYKYFKIVPIVYTQKDKDNISIQIAEQKQIKYALINLKNEDGSLIPIPIDFYEENRIKRFYVAYESGSGDVFRNWITRLFNNLKERREFGEKLYTCLEEENKVVMKEIIDNTDCVVLAWINLDK